MLDTFEMAESLSKYGKNGYSVLLSENNVFRERFESLPIRRLLVKKTHRLDTFDFLVQTLFSLRIISIKRAIKQLSPSVILFTMEHPWILPLTGLRKKGSQFPKLAYVRHNPMMFESGKSGLKNHLLSFVENRIIKKADYVFTLSDHVRKATIEEFGMNPKKVIDIGLGAHTSFCANWSHKTFLRDGILRLLFFGRILSYKGVDVLVAAYQKIKSEGLPVELTIAGDGEIGFNVIETASESGVRIINRWLEDSELCQLLSEADIVVLPYKKASQSGPASIATALGIPVIATRVGGLAEQVTSGVNGVLIDPNSHEEIVNAVKTFLSSPELFERYSEQAKKMSDGDLSWREKTIGIDNLFTELINAAT